MTIPVFILAVIGITIACSIIVLAVYMLLATRRDK